MTPFSKYVIKADLIRKGDSYGKKMGKKIISRWENVEIDGEFDFWIAEKILLERGIIIKCQEVKSRDLWYNYMNFNLREAVEKSLKAVVISIGKFKKTHFVD